MKQSYRDYFAFCKKILKMNYFLKISGISQSNFSLFMKSDAYDYTISLEKLDLLKENVQFILRKIV